MSAFLVSREHIRFLISAARSREFRDGSTFSYAFEGDLKRVELEDRDGFSKLGQILWDANRASINARYPDTVGKPGSEPGAYEGEPFIYGHGSDWRAPIKAVEVLKAIACLDYQSCE